MKLSELDYTLPQELIAQRPLERRDDSRLLVYDSAGGEVRHRRFSELADELEPDELVVVNDTRVIPARIPVERPRRAGYPTRRSRQLPAGHRRRAGAARAAQRALRGGAGGVGADPGGGARARRRNDHGAGARVARTRSAVTGPHRSLRHARLRVS